MSTESSSPSGAELVDEVSNWAVGGGMIVMALFPLALPILALTAIAVLPLLLPLLAIGLPIGIVALTIVFVRLVVRALRRSWGNRGSAEAERRNARIATDVRPAGVRR